MESIGQIKREIAKVRTDMSNITGERITLERGGKLRKYLNRKKITASWVQYAKKNEVLGDLIEQLKQSFIPTQENHITNALNAFLLSENAQKAKLAVDVSGSFVDGAPHLNLIIELFKEKYPGGEVLLFDRDIVTRYPVSEVTLPLANEPGGGTDYHCLFKEETDKLIVYTDGYGYAPRDSKTDTLWLLDGPNSQKPIYQDGNMQSATKIGQFVHIPEVSYWN